jgi:hypothetical protein
MQVYSLKVYCYNVGVAYKYGFVRNNFSPWLRRELVVYDALPPTDDCDDGDLFKCKFSVFLRAFASVCLIRIAFRCVRGRGVRQYPAAPARSVLGAPSEYNIMYLPSAAVTQPYAHVQARAHTPTCLHQPYGLCGRTHLFDFRKTFAKRSIYTYRAHGGVQP